MANVTTIYACTEDGLAIFNKPGTLNEWLPPRRVLTGAPVTAVWAEVGPPVRVVAIQEGSIQVSENGGRTWETIETEQRPLALFPGTSEQSLLVALQGGTLLGSEDGGTTWNTLPQLPGDGVTLLQAGEATHYLVTTEGLYAGQPYSGTWRLLLGDRAAAAHDPNTGSLYAATPDAIMKSLDAGERWSALPEAPRGVHALLAVPGAEGKPPALVAGTLSGISVSPDGGERWQQAEVNGEVSALARDPERRDRLYAGTREGYIFESGNRGQAWQPVNTVPLPPLISLFIVRI